MIEVTDEMVDSAALAFTNNPTEAVYVVVRRMLTAAFGVHEANKPKPEPVGYAWVVNNKVKMIADTELNSGFIPLYTTPPTQEPLSEDTIYELAEVFGEFAYGDAQGHKRIGFARAIEQAHRIT